MTEDINIEELVAEFMRLREQREEIEATDKTLKAAQDDIKYKILNVCNELKVESLKTKHGLIMKSLKERFYTQDWDGFHQWIIENNSPQLLEKRISQGVMKEYLEQNPDDGLPPGVNVFREYEVVIRKPVK